MTRRKAIILRAFLVALVVLLLVVVFLVACKERVAAGWLSHTFRAEAKVEHVALSRDRVTLSGVRVSFLVGGEPLGTTVGVERVEVRGSIFLFPPYHLVVGAVEIEIEPGMLGSLDVLSIEGGGSTAISSAEIGPVRVRMAGTDAGFNLAGGKLTTDESGNLSLSMAGKGPGKVVTTITGKSDVRSGAGKLEFRAKGIRLEDTFKMGRRFRAARRHLEKVSGEATVLVELSSDGKGHPQALATVCFKHTDVRLGPALAVENVDAVIGAGLHEATRTALVEFRRDFLLKAGGRTFAVSGLEAEMSGSGGEFRCRIFEIVPEQEPEIPSVGICGRFEIGSEEILLRNVEVDGLANLPVGKEANVYFRGLLRGNASFSKARLLGGLDVLPGSIVGWRPEAGTGVELSISGRASAVLDWSVLPSNLHIELDDAEVSSISTVAAAGESGKPKEKGGAGTGTAFEYYPGFRLAADISKERPRLSLTFDSGGGSVRVTRLCVRGRSDWELTGRVDLSADGRIDGSLALTGFPIGRFYQPSKRFKIGESGRFSRAWYFAGTLAVPEVEVRSAVEGFSLKSEGWSLTVSDLSVAGFEQSFVGGKKAAPHDASE